MPSKTLYYQNPRHLHQLYCGREDNLLAVEQAFNVKLATREDWLKIDGTDTEIARVEGFFTFLSEGRQQGLTVRNMEFAQLLEGFARGEGSQIRKLFSEPLVIATNRKSIVPKTIGQKLYLQSIQKNPVVFGIGPAGTGKTYLAVAAAISALLKNQVQRIILTRPAVEAGEALGFLPGRPAGEDPALPPAALRRHERHARGRGCRPAGRKGRRSKSRPSPTCAAARFPTPSSSSTRRRTPRPSR